ncbi:HNH endonuclease [Streptomyces phage Shawty]|uniref:HNH endonuclease n=1 Tax=Streptomyces phage Shawty TaxID=2510521 RepID=A0A411CYJ0_9CAUD|nr:HNH endonuclease [Streptomyces phage Shawty]
MKLCSTCGETKPLDEFYRRKASKDGRQHVCRVCSKAYNDSHPERLRASHLRQRYGITVEEYEARLAAQGGRCAVCPTTPEENGKALAVDHDHACCPNLKTCGKCIRGLLCNRCNKAIGLFADSADRLMSAVKYLGGAA